MPPDRKPLQVLSPAERTRARLEYGVDENLIPYDATPEERKAAIPMEPVASPTGTPVMPTWIGPLASALGAVALALTQILPPHTVGYTIAGAVLSLAGLFGPISAGWRK